MQPMRLCNCSLRRFDDDGDYVGDDADDNYDAADDDDGDANCDYDQDYEC